MMNCIDNACLQVKDEFIEWESRELTVLDSQHVVAFIGVIKNMVAKLKAGRLI